MEQKRKEFNDDLKIIIDRYRNDFHKELLLIDLILMASEEGSTDFLHNIVCIALMKEIIKQKK